MAVDASALQTRITHQQGLHVIHARRHVLYVLDLQQLSVQDVILLKIVNSTPRHLPATAKLLSTLQTIQIFAKRNHRPHVLKTTFSIRTVDSVMRFVEMENFSNFNVTMVILTMETAAVPLAKSKQTSAVCTETRNRQAFVRTMVELRFR